MVVVACSCGCGCCSCGKIISPVIYVADVFVANVVTFATGAVLGCNATVIRVTGVVKVMVAFHGVALVVVKTPGMVVPLTGTVDAKKLEHTHPDIQRSMSERVQVPILAICSKVGTF